MTSAAAASNTAATSSATTNTTGSSSNLGKMFMASQGLSMIMSLMGGFAGNSAANNEASALNAQADLALQEAERDAKVKRAQVLSAREDQAQAYNSSGVLLEGSPISVLSDTVRKGNEEIDAIIKRGNAMADLYRMKAKQAKSQGSSSLLSSVLGGGAGLANAWIMGNKLGLFGSGSSSSSSAKSSSNVGDFYSYTGDIA